MFRIIGDIAVEPWEPVKPTPAPSPIWTILGIVAGVAVITAVVIVILVKKKKGGK
ncbi:MAG: hypothetical protein IKP38_00085 [Clostridia bacterium]|nr:hypothetical protein [Clostridia bacterium]